MKLIVARHAEDRALARDIWGDASLTPIGKWQAQQLAHTLRMLHPTHLYSSPMKRAYETAQIIGQICGINLEVCKGLQEQDFGEILGVTPEERIKIDGPFVRSGTAAPPHIGPKGGETYAQLARRAKQVFQYLVSEHRDRNDRVVVVTHGRFLTFFVQAVLDFPWIGRFFLAIPNTGFLQFDIPKAGQPQLEVPSAISPPVNQSGIPASNFQFRSVEPLTKGLALVEDFAGRVGLIDENGTWLQTIREVGSRDEKEDVEQIKAMLVSYWTSQIVYAGVKLGIVDLLAEKPKTTVEVAETLDLDEPSTEKLLQALKILGILTQENEGLTYRVSTMAQILTAEHPTSLGTAAVMWGEEHYTAWQGLAESVQTGTVAFERVYGKPFFNWLEDHPEKATLYHAAMTSYALQDYQDIPDLYDFSQHQTLTDVGGGQGTLLSLILRAYPELKGILVERQSALKMAATYLEQTGVLDRCTLIEGSFFYLLPKGSDCIILSRIIHDWDDNHTRMILKNCFSALPPRGALLLIELIVPETPQTDVGVSLNLNMLAMTGGQERTEEAYRTLLLESGFENIAIVGTTSLVSLMKATKPPKT